MNRKDTAAPAWEMHAGKVRANEKPGIVGGRYIPSRFIEGMLLQPLKSGAAPRRRANRTEGITFASSSAVLSVYPSSADLNAASQAQLPQTPLKAALESPKDPHPGAERVPNQTHFPIRGADFKKKKKHLILLRRSQLRDTTAGTKTHGRLIVCV